MQSKLPNLTPQGGLNLDFWKFWAGQTISNLGSSFTAFALPLLIYKLTGSALNLALATAAAFLPYLLFGLLIWCVGGPAQPETAHDCRGSD